MDGKLLYFFFILVYEYSLFFLDFKDIFVVFVSFDEVVSNDDLVKFLFLVDLVVVDRYNFLFFFDSDDDYKNVRGC